MQGHEHTRHKQTRISHREENAIPEKVGKCASPDSGEVDVGKCSPAHRFTIFTERPSYLRKRGRLFEGGKLGLCQELGRSLRSTPYNVQPAYDVAGSRERFYSRPRTRSYPATNPAQCLVARYRPRDITNIVINLRRNFLRGKV